MGVSVGHAAVTKLLLNTYYVYMVTSQNVLNFYFDRLGAQTGERDRVPAN